MLKFGRGVTKFRKLILVIALLLLIPSAIGYFATAVNYNILTYLPKSIDTVKGQDILLDEFNKGGFTMIVVEGMDKKEVADFKSKVEDVKHVESVIWYDSIMDLSVPEEMLPKSVYQAFNNKNATVMAAFFDTPVSDEGSLNAIQEIRKIGKEQCFVSGMSAFVTDVKLLSEHEEPVYVAIAVACALVILLLFTDSWLVGIVFLIGIGMTIIYNMGSNVFLGEISYITKALSAVLQLAVTMDYSIFLWHSYEEHRAAGYDRLEAMSYAISRTLTSVLGSSLTTIAGFLALCFMTFTLGLNLGIVMAKGVLLGVIGSVTILPALILALEKPIEKTRHRPIMPNFGRLSGFVTKNPVIFGLLFLVLIVPAFIGYTHTDVYYNLDRSVPDYLPFRTANNKLIEDFDMNTQHMILVDSDTPRADVRKMIDEIEDVDGINAVLGMDSALGATIPEEMVPSSLNGVVKSENYQLMIVSSTFAVASDQVNHQIDEINKIIKKYDEGGMLIGEAPCTKDLITISDHDFRTVTAASVVVIFFIILLVLQSVSLPFILVACIELAIFINLGIPFFTGTTMSFIDSICIGTIQLGATVDYAILMTNRYRRERFRGIEKREAVRIAHSTSMPSITISAFGFCAATLGVGLYSDIDIISSMCTLMGRGALISWLVVMFILPAMFVIFDKIIIKTGKGFIDKKRLTAEEGLR